MATCPNINLDSWKNLVAARGEDIAYYLWDKYAGNVPEAESKSQVIKAALKSVNALQSNKAIQLFSTLQKNRVTGDVFWNKIQQDLQIPKEQIELLKQYNTTNREQLITNMLADYSFAIEINTAKGLSDSGLGLDDYDENGKIKPESERRQRERPTDFYSNLTVPGGTNYTENEIATPAITPSIKGHAQFAADQGIGWFRSDDKTDDTFTGEEYDNEDFGIDPITGESITRPIKTKITSDRKITKTRRILEVQSDLFQKGRDRKSPDEIIEQLKKEGKLQIKCD